MASDEHRVMGGILWSGTGLEVGGKELLVALGGPQSVSWCSGWAKRPVHVLGIKP
jgi:hypothetical protein